MADLIRKDIFKGLFAWPRWLEEFEETFPTLTSQRGLRIHETDKEIIVEAVVAGVPAKDVNVEIEDGVLTIKAESKEEKKAKEEYESKAYRYYYTCALSGGQWDKAEAEVKNGIVSVVIPKTETARARKVPVKARE